MVTAFAEGLASQDVLATVKHFPGLGRVARNTDRFVETVASRPTRSTRTSRRSARPIEAGVPLVMLSNATYTALDPDNAAGWSRAIATDLLRGELGFTGVTITDSPQRDRGVAGRLRPVARGGGGERRDGHDDASRASRRRPRAPTTSSWQRAASGALDRAALEASYQRILASRRRSAIGAGSASPARLDANPQSPARDGGRGPGGDGTASGSACSAEEQPWAMACSRCGSW